ncbi:MAG: hypothetical protein WCD79_01320 [Chthoniobacteraceae bacterium]
MKIVFAILLLMMCATPVMRADDLTTITGITYKNATITGHDAIGLKIMFDDGFARVRFQDLPDKFRVKYGYDPVAEAAQLRKEAQIEDQQAAALRAALKRQNKETARQDAEVEATAIKVQLQGRLVSNTEEGLLLTKQYVVPGAQGDEVRQEIYLLRGYPHPSQVASNQQITATALPDGTYKYSAEDGTLKTVRAYRYVEAPSPPDDMGLQGSALDVPAH